VCVKNIARSSLLDVNMVVVFTHTHTHVHTHTFAQLSKQLNKAYDFEDVKALKENLRDILIRHIIVVHQKPGIIYG